MMQIKKSQSRGKTDIDWLKSYHSFSFGDYIDPENKGFGKLRVINEDEILPGAGFGTHPHWNMEILTYVTEGALEHRDSMGNHGVIKAGDVQLMSAGTGVEHSEFNPSPTNRVKLLQLWMLPNTKDTQPGYQQKHFDPEQRKGRLQLIASADARDGSLAIKQDLDLYAALLDQGQSFTYQMPRNKAWIQVANGSLEVNGNKLDSGDALAVDEQVNLEFANAKQAEFLLWSLN